MELATPMWDGNVHPAYANPRPDVVEMVPVHARHVLDVGCSTGHMGEALRARGHHVTGVEQMPALAAEARTRLDRVVEADIEALTLEERGLDTDFDCIVFADVLEHLHDPWAVVRWGERQLAPGGVIVVSVPNIRHAETFWTLAVRVWWPYKEVGIFDRTHLRFFARKNLPELFTGTDLAITEIRRVYRLRNDMTARINRFARYLGDLGTMQFVLRAEQISAASA
jgi:2-polyprenyl-3-methyl-5-hydroxy-6-metoxy-1,4-benzoquinol methylase